MLYRWNDIAEREKQAKEDKARAHKLEIQAEIAAARAAQASQRITAAAIQVSMLPSFLLGTSQHHCWLATWLARVW